MKLPAHKLPTLFSKLRIPDPKGTLVWTCEGRGWDGEQLMLSATNSRKFLLSSLPPLPSPLPRNLKLFQWKVLGYVTGRNVDSCAPFSLWILWSICQSLCPSEPLFLLLAIFCFKVALKVISLISENCFCFRNHSAHPFLVMKVLRCFLTWQWNETPNETFCPFHLDG